MPNWCSHIVNITGKKESLDALDKQFKGKHISYGSSTIHTASYNPEEYKDKKHRVLSSSPGASVTIHVIDTIEEEESYSFANFVQPTEDDYLNDWYEWNCTHWGTKWDVVDLNMDRSSDTELTYRFDTAWSPCVPVLEVMASTYPDLVFEVHYIDEGLFFAGTLVYSNGELELDYEVPKEQLKDFAKDIFDFDYYDEDEEYEEDAETENQEVVQYTAVLNTNLSDIPLVVIPDDDEEE